MFEVGDRVKIGGFEKPIYGRIESFYYDEGNVWMVRTDGGNLWDCSDSELNPFEPCRTTVRRATPRGGARRNYYGEFRRFRGYHRG